jgi:hypothetical protein
VAKSGFVVIALDGVVYGNGVFVAVFARRDVTDAR